MDTFPHNVFLFLFDIRDMSKIIYQVPLYTYENKKKTLIIYSLLFSNYDKTKVIFKTLELESGVSLLVQNQWNNESNSHFLGIS